MPSQPIFKSKSFYHKILVKELVEVAYRTCSYLLGSTLFSSTQIELSPVVKGMKDLACPPYKPKVIKLEESKGGYMESMFQEK